MGPGSWTQELMNLQMSKQQIINVDGPYGNTLDNFKEHETVVFVAGGIGITPFHSVLKYDYQRTSLEMNDKRKHSKVILFWIVRDVAVLSLFKDTFQRIQSNTLSGMYHIYVYCTQAVEDGIDGKFKYKKGRPDWETVFSDMSSGSTGSRKVVVCGPANLEKEISDMCYRYDCEFQAETFEL